MLSDETTMIFDDKGGLIRIHRNRGNRLVAAAFDAFAGIVVGILVGCIGRSFLAAAVVEILVVVVAAVVVQRERNRSSRRLRHPCISMRVIHLLLQGTKRRCSSIHANEAERGWG